MVCLSTTKQKPYQTRGRSCKQNNRNDNTNAPKRAKTKPISIITKIKFEKIMLRRHRSSRIRKTRKIKIKLITTSVHLVCKKIRQTVFLQRVYWAETEDGIEAFNLHAFDEDTQKEIRQKCMHLKNLDFRIDQISSDPSIQKEIIRMGYFYREPSERWILQNQNEAIITSADHTITVDE